eukprot:7234184-Prymnesium_polylepis.1
MVEVHTALVSKGAHNGAGGGGGGGRDDASANGVSRVHTMQCAKRGAARGARSDLWQGCGDAGEVRLDIR